MQLINYVFDEKHIDYFSETTFWKDLLPYLDLWFEHSFSAPISLVVKSFPLVVKTPGKKIYVPITGLSSHLKFPNKLVKELKDTTIVSSNFHLSNYLHRIGIKTVDIPPNIRNHFNFIPEYKREKIFFWEGETKNFLRAIKNIKLNSEFKIICLVYNKLRPTELPKLKNIEYWDWSKENLEYCYRNFYSIDFKRWTKGFKYKNPRKIIEHLVCGVPCLINAESPQYQHLICHGIKVCTFDDLFYVFSREYFDQVQKIREHSYIKNALPRNNARLYYELYQNLV